jgi:ABC-type phosphate/phosphonate transport system substrate-binding protein
MVTPPVATLPMYDLPELRDATDQWWLAIQRALTAAGIADVPKSLDRSIAREDAWRNPGLLLTQTCGYPLTFGFQDHLRAVAVPTYRAEGCEPGIYRSAFVVRADDDGETLEHYRGRKVAANGPDSQSGCNCLRAKIAPLARGGPFFSKVIWSGAHRASLDLVASVHADIAAVDAVTLALIRQVAPGEFSRLRVLGWSDPAPALPYATPLSTDEATRARIRKALSQAVADPQARSARETLLIEDFQPIDSPDYQPIIEMVRSAEHLGYPALA